MALETDFSNDDHLFIGEDKHVLIGGGSGYHILVHPGGGSAAVVNVAAFAMTFEIRNELADAAAVFTLTTTGGEITVTGVYNSSQASNTQAVDCFITDTNSLLLTEGTKHWALKRMDNNVETIIAFGTMPWRYAAVR